MKKKFALSLFAIIAVLILIVFVFITNSSKDKIQSSKENVDHNLLVGNWVRTDANYLVKINKVNADGPLEAQYFNPKPINVESATWEENYGNIKIVIELRDVNYPGSTYTLNYLPDRDMLSGDYYQAVEGLTFYVEFVRNK